MKIFKLTFSLSFNNLLNLKSGNLNLKITNLMESSQEKYTSEANSLESYLEKKREDEEKFEEIIKSKILKVNSRDLETLGNLNLFPELKRLTVLNLSHNLIYSLKGISLLENLTSLTLSYNKLEDIKELKRINFKRSIINLDIDFNPLTNHPNYRLILIDIFPSLQFLDGLEIDSSIENSYKDVYLKLSQILIPFLTLLDFDVEIVENLIDKIEKLKSGEIEGKKPSLNKLLFEAYNDSHEGELSNKILRPEQTPEEIIKKYAELTRYARICNILNLKEKFNSEGDEEMDNSEKTKFLISLLKELIKNIQNYTNNFKGIQFLSGIELTAMYEDIFRKMTLEYTDENDFSLDNYLKKKLLKSYSTSSENDSFIEQFNNDPIFAFDSLLESFYHIWPVNEEASSSVLGFNEEKYIINDLDSTSEIDKYVDEKLVKIKRGYSVEFASKYYDQISEKESRIKNYRLKNKRQIKMYFPSFPYNNDYCKRLFKIITDRIESFGLAFLDLSDIAQSAELTDRSTTRLLSENNFSQKVDTLSISEVDFKLTNTAQDRKEEYGESLDSKRRETSKRKERVTSSKKDRQDEFEIEERESSRYNKLDEDETNINLDGYDVGEIKILDPLDDPEVKITLFDPDEERRLKRNENPELIISAKSFLGQGPLPVVPEVAESRTSAKKLLEDNEDGNDLDEARKLNLAKEESKSRNLRSYTYQKLVLTMFKLFVNKKSETFLELKKMRAAWNLGMLLKWWIVHPLHYEFNRKEYMKDSFSKIQGKSNLSQISISKFSTKSFSLDINKKWFVRRLYQKLHENYMRDIKHNFWLLLSRAEILSSSTSKSAKISLRRSHRSSISQVKKNDSHYYLKSNQKSEEIHFKRNFETFGSRKSNNTLDSKEKHIKIKRIENKEIEKKIGEKFDNFRIKQKLNFGEDPKSNWVNKEIKEGKQFWDMTKELPSEWKGSQKKEEIIFTNSPYSKLNEEFSDISDIYPSVITRKASEKKNKKEHKTERAKYKENLYEEKGMKRGQNSLRMIKKTTPENIFSPVKKFDLEFESKGDKSVYIPSEWKRLSQGFVTESQNESYPLASQARSHRIDETSKTSGIRQPESLIIARKNNRRYSPFKEKSAINSKNLQVPTVSLKSQNVDESHIEFSPNGEYKRFEETSNISSVIKENGVPRFSDYSGFNPRTSKYLHTPIYKLKKIKSGKVLPEGQKIDFMNESEKISIMDEREERKMREIERKRFTTSGNKSKGISLRSKHIDFTVRRTENLSDQRFIKNFRNSYDDQNPKILENKLLIRKEEFDKSARENEIQIEKIKIELASRRRSKSKPNKKKKKLKKKGKRSKSRKAKRKRSRRRTPFKEIQNVKTPFKKRRNSRSNAKKSRGKSKKGKKRSRSKKRGSKSKKRNMNSNQKKNQRKKKLNISLKTKFQNPKLDNPFKSQRSTKNHNTGRRWSITREKSLSKVNKVIQLAKKYTPENSRSVSKGRKRKRKRLRVQGESKVNVTSYVKDKCEGIKKFNEFMDSHQHTGPYCEACRIFMLRLEK